MSPQLNVAFANWLPGGLWQAANRRARFILFFAFGFLSSHIRARVHGFDSRRCQQHALHDDRLGTEKTAACDPSHRERPALEPVDAELLKAEADNVQPEVQAPSQTTLPADTTAKPAQAEINRLRIHQCGDEETEKK